MRKIWTDEMLSRLQELKPHKTNAELAEIFGTTPSALANKCTKMGIRRGSQPNQIHLTQEQRRWLIKNFPNMSNEICAIYLGIRVRSVVRIARKELLEKTPQFMRECQAHTTQKAKESYYRRGEPLKGWYSPNLQKGEKYQFKKSEKPNRINGKVKTNQNREEATQY